MERRVIKLPTGYLNVDEGAITFTRSGNWGEAANVKERTAAITIGTAVRVILGALLLALVFLAGVVRAERRGSGNSTAIFALVLAFVATWIFFQKLKDGFLSSFKIPLAKVKALRYEKNEAVIEFVNARWKDDTARAEISEADFALIEESLRASRS